MSAPRCFCWMLICIAAAGCSSTKQSNTARTAREQLLVSGAIDQSLSKVDFSSLNGQKVYLEEKYLECTDKGYLVSSIRHRAMYNGARIVGKPEDADIVLEQIVLGNGRQLLAAAVEAGHAHQVVRPDA